MVTSRTQHRHGRRTGLRLGAGLGSGLLALAASTTVSHMRLRSRRRRGRTEFVAPGGTCIEPASPTANGCPQRETTTTPAAGIEVAAPGPSSAPHHQPAYGVGFDQHSAHARGRAIAWIVVAVITAGTCIGGVSLIVAEPWLFWTGAGVVVAGIVVGCATHAMRDEMAPLPTESPRELSGRQPQPSGISS